MSNYWDIHCADCKEGAGMSVNHGHDTLAIIVSKIESIIAADLMTRILFDDSGIEVEISHYQIGPMVPFMEFFRNHQGHNLVPVDEYGREE